ncbi:ERF superfamily protein [compost metagenome]
MKYKIIDIETGNFEILASSGTGVDTQDKGVGKAMTYSYKYLLLRTFAIPTGEDPDKVSSAELDEKQRIEREERAREEEKTLDQMRQKWKILNNDSLDGFESWVSSMRAKGAPLTQLHELLAKRLVDKNIEDKKGA